MPSHKQTTVEPVTTERSMGSSSTADLQSAYPTSPIHAGELTNDIITEMGDSELLSELVNDGGHTFGELSRDYADAPTIADVETGSGGLPSTPWTPGLASPGEGSMNAADMPEGPTPADPGTEFGSGVGSANEPSTTSAQHASHTIGSLMSGKAPGTS